MAQSRHIITDAIILQTKVIGEHNKLVTFISPELGVASATAYGAARLKSKFCSTLQNFSKLRLFLNRSPKNGFFKLEDIAMVQSAQAISKDLTAFYIMCFCSEIVTRSYISSEEYRKYFFLFNYTLELVEAREAGADAANKMGFLFFTVKYLFLAGYSFRTGACKTCGNLFDTYYFDPLKGGLYCEDHTGFKRYPLSSLEASVLGDFFSKKFSELKNFTLPDMNFYLLFIFLSDYIKTLFDGRLKSLTMLYDFYGKPGNNR